LEDSKEAGILQVPGDLNIWVHQVLHRVVFDEEITSGQATEFAMLQRALLSKATTSQILPGSLYGLVGYKDILFSLHNYLEKYKVRLEERWRSALVGKDCSPSEDCLSQLASSVWDALYAAGGASVPAGIASGLALLYSSSASNPARDFEIPPGTAPQFFWECLRFFPPVYGVPYWTSRPSCYAMTHENTVYLNNSDGMTIPCPEPYEESATGAPPSNQWLGGRREVLDVGRAQRDKSRWGADADRFVVRPLETYNNNSVGFAEMAVDKTVAQGKNDRSCPARELAIAIGAIFFEEFVKDRWEVENADTDIKMDPFRAFEQIEPFDLVPAGGLMG